MRSISKPLQALGRRLSITTGVLALLLAGSSRADAQAAYRDSIIGITSTSSLTVDPSTLTHSSGDVLLLHVCGYTSLGNPSGSDLTWTEIATAGASRTGPFSATDIAKVWWAVSDGSITSFTIAHGETDQINYVLTSISSADTTTPVDASGVSNGVYDTGAGGTDPTAPSISPTGADSLLVAAACTWNGSDHGLTFTPPSGMTEREDGESWDAMTLATLGLSASGATGTKLFTESPDIGTQNSVWIANSIAVKSSGGGGGGGKPAVTRGGFVGVF